jgi:hypothetical protein
LIWSALDRIYSFNLKQINTARRQENKYTTQKREFKTNKNVKKHLFSKTLNFYFFLKSFVFTTTMSKDHNPIPNSKVVWWFTNALTSRTHTLSSSLLSLHRVTHSLTKIQPYQSLLLDLMGTIQEPVSVAEERLEGVQNDTVYVAVGNNAEKNHKLLHWVIHNFSGKKICLLHIHQPDLINSLSESDSDSLQFSQFIIITSFF